MNNSDSLLTNYPEFFPLIADREISDEEFATLKALLKNNKAARNAYYDMINLEVLLRDSKGLGEEFEETPYIDTGFWQLLAHEEQTKPAIEISKEQPQRELIQKVIWPQKNKYKVSKFSILGIAINAAAILFIVLFLKFAPQRYHALEVATLVDQLNVKWAHPNKIRERGSRLWTDEGPLDLKQGMVKIRYDDGVDVVIEGPALFEINQSQIYLEYGRLYGCVSESGLGFRVETPTSQFLDHGTEFGVLANIDGSSELHVMEGKVELFTGSRGQFKSCQIVPEKKAIKYNANVDQVNKIPIQKEVFARSFNSESKMVWRGKMHLNLADIIGGGNGFGSGVTNTGVEATTGKMLTRLLNYDPFIGSSGYKAVHSSPYIDGVFIPGAGDDTTSITSEGSHTATFPHASGALWGYIFNGAFHQGTQTARSPLQLGGVVFGTPDHPAITIHSNQGVTFDLSEIRKSLPGLSITAFRSLAGISQTVQDVLEKKEDGSSDILPDPQKGFNADRSNVEFWVFLDEKQVFHQKISSADKVAELEMPIASNIRFLTLAVTESDDGVSYDWALFGRPELTLELARQ